MLPSTKELHRLFTKINEDCRRSGETVEPLTNHDYYAEQIENIYEVPQSEAIEAAIKLANFK